MAKPYMVSEEKLAELENAIKKLTIDETDPAPEPDEVETPGEEAGEVSLDKQLAELQEKYDKQSELVSKLSEQNEKLMNHVTTLVNYSGMSKGEEKPKDEPEKTLSELDFEM